MTKSLFSLGWSETSVQKIITILCKELDVPNLVIMPLNTKYAIEENVLGEYWGLTKGFYQARLVAENDMKTALHELVHHIQFCSNYNVKTPHDNTFTKASTKLVAAIIKKFGKKAFPQDKSILRSSYSNNCESNFKLNALSAKGK